MAGVDTSNADGMALDLTPPPLPPILLASELGPSATRALLEAGSHVRVRRGAITPALTSDDRWDQARHLVTARIAAVGRKLRNGAVTSHDSAAVLLGLWTWRTPEVVHVTQRTKSNGHGSPGLRRHSAMLPEEHVTTVNGLRVTTVQRTIIDAARTMHPLDALVIADSGLRLLARADKFHRAASEARIARVRHMLLSMVDDVGGNGRRRARAVVQSADPFSESPYETAARWAAIAHGLPVPVSQRTVVTRDGTFFPDFTWEFTVVLDGQTYTFTLFGEYDGNIQYVPGALVANTAEIAKVIQAERRREKLIREAHRPCEVVRLDSADVHDPRTVVALLMAALPAGAQVTLTLVPELLVGPRSGPWATSTATGTHM